MWDQGLDLAPNLRIKLLQSGDLSDFDMIHSLVEVLLLPQLISLIWFSYCLTAAPQRYAFLRLKIHAFCTSAYVIIHTLHTHTVHQTHAMNISPWFILFTTILSNTTPLLFFLPLSIYLPIPPSLTRLFSPRMETQRPRSCCTATMWFVTTPMRHCALAKWTPMRMCYWPASTATSTAGDPTSPPR